MKKIPNTKGEMKMNNLMTYRKTFAMLVIAMLSLSALLTAVPVKAAGTVHCVPNSMIDPSCSDGHSTIQAAIYDAVAGDTVLVGAGTYAGSDVAQSVTIVSTQGAVIDCGVPGGTPSGFQIQYYTVSDVTIDGFKITNCDSGIVISGTRTYSNIVIKNSDIYANRNYGIFVYNPTVDGLTIENVKLRDSLKYEGMHNAAGTITNLVIKNSEITNNKGTFGFVSKGKLYGAIFDTLKILNNGESGIGLLGTANDVTITGCTFSNSNGYEVYLGFWGNALSTTGTTITSNNFLTTSGWTDVYIGAKVSFSTGAIKINYNNFLGSWVWGVENYATTKVDAYNNWWGRQAGPGGNGAHVKNADYDPWLVITATASPTNLFVGATSTITADMTKNSAGVDTSSSGHIPDGTQIIFATDLGSIGSSSVPTTDGKATTTLTSLTLGTAHVTVSAPPFTSQSRATTNVRFFPTTGPTISKSIPGTPKFTPSGGGNTYVTSATVMRVSVTDIGGGVASCSITVTEPGGVTINPSCTPAAGDHDFTLSGPDGAYTISATAADDLGTTSSDPLTVILDNTPPTFGSCPVDGLFAFNSGMQPVGPIYADDGTGSGVDSGASTLTGSVDTSAIGTKTVTFTAVDNLGNSATKSCSYEVTINAAKQKVLADLIALRKTVTDKDGQKLDEAIKHLTKSLDSDLWTDGNHLSAKHGEKVFNEEKDAIVKLVELMKDKKSKIPDTVLQDFVHRLVGADRALAQVAIDDASIGGDPKKIDKANEEAGKGDARALDDKFTDAIEHYRNAWKHAIEAMP